MKKIPILILALALYLGACSTPAAVERVETDIPEAEVVNTPVAVTEVVSDASADAEEIFTPEIEPETDTSVNGLSAAEIEGLIFMREEEKLARDVYLTLYEQWNTAIFQNIAESESAHMNAVLTLLTQYEIEDPVGDKAIGEFQNDDLQTLYDQLVAQGSQSLSEAIKVGAAIEEIDILDLEEYIAQTDQADLIAVYENLVKGSRNHLRSFTETLTQQTGENYTPQYLSPEAYEAIVDPGLETGGQGNGNGNGNGQ